MAGALIGMRVDDGQLGRYIASLKSDEKKVMKECYKKSLQPIMKDAQKGAKASIRSKTMHKGVRLSAWKSSKGASVYIRSPKDNFYKLLFFEAGTADFGKVSKIKKGVRRGRIRARWFFKAAVDKHMTDMPRIFQEEFSKALDNAARKSRRGSFGDRYKAAKGR